MLNKTAGITVPRNSVTQRRVLSRSPPRFVVSTRSGAAVSVSIMVNAKRSNSLTLDSQKSTTPRRYGRRCDPDCAEPKSPVMMTANSVNRLPKCHELTHRR